MTMNAIEGYNEVIKNGSTPCFEVGEGVIYFEPKNKTAWSVGTACNVGLLADFVFEYDADFSVDENLQAMIEDAEDFYSKED